MSDDAPLPTRDIAHVIAPPPLIYLVPLLIALAVGHWWPRPVLPPSMSLIIGSLLLVCGIVFLYPAISVFRRARTPAEPWKPTSALVAAGPYRITRNPMYVGFTFVYTGISLAVNSLWPLLLLPVILVVMQRLVIQREERYLERKFGDKYREYASTVRRWL
jgi:protein-S-isoprenylcysteine O-methyltransferase Ste14